MRSLSIIIGILIPAPMLFGAEITTSLDRCVILNSENDDAAETRVALHFTLPEEVSGNEIIYAELTIPVTTRNQGSDSLFEFVVFPAISNWSERDIDYDQADGIADSLSAGAFTVNLARSNEFLIDITTFVGEINVGARSNYGLIMAGDLLGDCNLQIPDSQNETMRNNTSLKLVYK